MREDTWHEVSFFQARLPVSADTPSLFVAVTGEVFRVVRFVTALLAPPHRSLLHVHYEWSSA